MKKEIVMFATKDEKRKIRNIEYNKQLKKVQDELKKLSCEENVHQTEKSKEFGGIQSGMVGSKKEVDTLN